MIVGRCADYALAEDPRRLSVFIHAPAQVRLERVCTLYGLSRREAETAMAKTDKRRANYHNFYSDKKWGAATTYHLCVDSSINGIDGTVELLDRFMDNWKR